MKVGGSSPFISSSFISSRSTVFGLLCWWPVLAGAVFGFAWRPLLADVLAWRVFNDNRGACFRRLERRNRRSALRVTQVRRRTRPRPRSLTYRRRHPRDEMELAILHHFDSHGKIATGNNVDLVRRLDDDVLVVCSGRHLVLLEIGGLERLKNILFKSIEQLLRYSLGVNAFKGSKRCVSRAVLPALPLKAARKRRVFTSAGAAVIVEA